MRRISARKFIHKSTGNPYLLIDENHMVKINGEWVKGFCLYQTAYHNPDGKYFARPKEEFFEKFEEAKEWEEDKQGCVICPHCKTQLQELYDGNDLDVAYSSNVHTVKDPCFCESSSSVTVYYRCPKCGGLIEEYISWDN